MSIEGWRLSTLGTVTDIVMGQSPDSKFYSEEEIGLPFLQGCAEFTNKHPKANLYCSQVKKVAPTGSILFSVRAPVGRTNVADRDYIIGRGLSAFLAKEIDVDYLHQYLIYSELEFRQAAQGSTFEAINSKELSDWSIKFPELQEEQEKISIVLSTIDRAIEQTEAIITKQQRIKTGLMQDLLTKGIDENGNIRSEETHEFKDSAIGRIPVKWSIKPIGNIASLQRGHDIREVDLMPGVYPVVASSGVIGFHNTGTSSSPNVVVGRKGSIGNVHYVDTDFWAHDTSLYVTNFFGNNEKYIYYLFSYLKLERFGTKSGSPSLNRNDVHPLKVPFPDVVEQRRISSMLSEFDTSMESIKCALSKLKVKKIGLMQDLLTGKVRVTPILQTGGDRLEGKGRNAVYRSGLNG